MISGVSPQATIAEFAKNAFAANYIGNSDSRTCLQLTDVCLAALVFLCAEPYMRPGGYQTRGTMIMADAVAERNWSQKEPKRSLRGAKEENCDAETLVARGRRDRGDRDAVGVQLHVAP